MVTVSTMDPMLETLQLLSTQGSHDESIDVNMPTGAAALQRICRCHGRTKDVEARLQLAHGACHARARADANAHVKFDVSLASRLAHGAQNALCHQERAVHHRLLLRFLLRPKLH